MQRYITVLEGETARKAEPVLVTSDRRIISEIAEAITRRIEPSAVLGKPGGLHYEAERTTETES